MLIQYNPIDRLLYNNRLNNVISFVFAVLLVTLHHKRMIIKKQWAKTLISHSF